MVCITGSRCNTEDLGFFGESKTVDPGNAWSQENQSISRQSSFLYHLPSFLMICMHTERCIMYALSFRLLFLLMPCNDPLFSGSYLYFLFIPYQNFLFSRKYIIHICNSDGIYLRVEV